MTTQVELESKIGGLEFIIQSIRDRLDHEIFLCEDSGKTDRVMSDYEKGMRKGMLYQTESLKIAFEGIIKSGALLEKELSRINTLK